MSYTVTYLATDYRQRVIGPDSVWTEHTSVYDTELDAVRACFNNYVNIRVQSVTPEPAWENFSYGKRPQLPQVHA